MTRYLHIAALLLAGAVSPAVSDVTTPCQAPGTITCAKWTVGQRLEKESAALVDRGFTILDPGQVSVIDKGGSDELHIDLEPSVEYALVAACGHDCGRVAIALSSEKQDQIGASSDEQPVVILAGNVPDDGTYVATLTAPGCHHIFCGVGLAILRK